MSGQALIGHKNRNSCCFTILQFENINSIIIVSKFLAKLEIYKFKLDKNITCSRR